MKPDTGNGMKGGTPGRAVNMPETPCSHDTVKDGTAPSVDGNMTLKT